MAVLHHLLAFEDMMSAKMQFSLQLTKETRNKINKETSRSAVTYGLWGGFGLCGLDV